MNRRPNKLLHRPSPRPFPETLPSIEYGPGDQVRKVQDGGWISYGGRPWRLPRAFRGCPVALRPAAAADGRLDVVFCGRRIGRIDLRAGEERVKNVGHEDGLSPLEETELLT